MATKKDDKSVMDKVGDKIKDAADAVQDKAQDLKERVLPKEPTEPKPDRKPTKGRRD